MRSTLLHVLVVWLAAAVPAMAGSIPPAEDFGADARHSRQLGVPIVVLFSATDCPYCDAVKSEVFSWMVEDPAYEGVIFRVLEIDTATRLVDFDLHALTAAEFARRHDVWLTPTVHFLDADGSPLVDPLVGVGVIDFYAAYVDRSLRRARQRLAAGR